MIKLVIFDLDDTLYDEIDYCRSGFSAVGRYLAEKHTDTNPEAIFKTLWDQFTSGNHTRTFNIALESHGINYDENLIRLLVQHYRDHKPDITLPSDSWALLDELKEKYTLALLTDGFMPAQQLKVQALGIEGDFSVVVYTELLGREHWKPSTLGYEQILRQFNISAEHAIYIADNAEKDFIGPNSLGMPSIHVQRPNGIHAEKAINPASRPTYAANSIAEIPQLLANL